MARYRTDVDRWISHECRMVKAGEEFDAEFPKGMRLSDTLHLVEAAPAKKQGGGKPAGDDLT